MEITSSISRRWGPRIMVTKQNRVKCVAKYVVSPLISGQQQWSFDIMRQNLLDELTDVLDERRSINVVSPNFFMRNPATKQLKMVPSSISYGLVFDKRVIGHALFRSYHYGYTSALDDGDILQSDWSRAPFSDMHCSLVGYCLDTRALLFTTTYLIRIASM